MVTRWEFYDPTVPVSYTLEINPAEATGPTRAKKIDYATPAGPDGTVIIYEGRELPPDMSFSGSLLTQTHYEALEAWYRKRTPIEITDDLDRIITCYIKTFQPKRAPRHNSPWRHTFDMAVVVMAIDNPPVAS